MNKFKKGEDEKNYSVKCNKCKKFKNPKISYVCNKTLVLSIIYGNCNSKDEKIVKEEESSEILKILGLIKNMGEHQINI